MNKELFVKRLNKLYFFTPFLYVDFNSCSQDRHHQWILAEVTTIGLDPLPLAVVGKEVHLVILKPWLGNPGNWEKGPSLNKIPWPIRLFLKLANVRSVVNRRFHQAQAPKGPHESWPQIFTVAKLSPSTSESPSSGILQKDSGLKSQISACIIRELWTP